MKKMTVEELRERMILHKAWLDEEKGGVRASMTGLDLSGHDLAGSNMRYAIMDRCFMPGVFLHNANLHHASMRFTILRRACLSGARLYSADFAGANLHYANLRGAELRCASFRNADLTGADFTGADITRADFTNANLASCKGIQFVQLAFQGLGAESRQWSAVKINGVWQVFCGSWNGTLEELRLRIEVIAGPHLESRRRAFGYIFDACTHQEA